MGECASQPRQRHKPAAATTGFMIHRESETCPSVSSHQVTRLQLISRPTPGRQPSIVSAPHIRCADVSVSSDIKCRETKSVCGSWGFKLTTSKNPILSAEKGAFKWGHCLLYFSEWMDVKGPLLEFKVSFLSLLSSIMLSLKGYNTLEQSWFRSSKAEWKCKSLPGKRSRRSGQLICGEKWVQMKVTGRKPRSSRGINTARYWSCQDFTWELTWEQFLCFSFCLVETVKNQFCWNQRRWKSSCCFLQKFRYFV